MMWPQRQSRRWSQWRRKTTSQCFIGLSSFSAIEHVDHESLWKASIGSQEDVGRDAFRLALPREVRHPGCHVPFASLLIENSPTCISNSTGSMSQTKCVHPGNFPPRWSRRKSVEEMINIVQKPDNSMKLVISWISSRLLSWTSTTMHCCWLGLSRFGSKERSSTEWKTFLLCDRGKYPRCKYRGDSTGAVRGQGC